MPELFKKLIRPASSNIQTFASLADAESAVAAGGFDDGEVILVTNTNTYYLITSDSLSVVEKNAAFGTGIIGSIYAAGGVSDSTAGSTGAAIEAAGDL